MGVSADEQNISVKLSFLIKIKLNFSLYLLSYNLQYTLSMLLENGLFSKG